METKTIYLKKMNTKADVEKVSKVLHDVWGIRNVEVNADNGRATFSYDEKAASIIDFQQAITDCGFEIESAGNSSRIKDA